MARRETPSISTTGEVGEGNGDVAAALPSPLGSGPGLIGIWTNCETLLSLFISAILVFVSCRLWVKRRMSVDKLTEQVVRQHVGGNTMDD